MTPVTWAALAAGLAERADLPGVPRVLLDGVGTAELSDAVSGALLARGRVPLQVRAGGFWRPAGERFEHGHEDWQAFRDSWLDTGALRREVLDARGSWLPALWDAERDRSARLPVQLVPERAVIVVDGLFLQGLGLPAELTVHVALSPGALRRRGVPVWQLPAFTTYDDDIRPGDLCDVLVRAEDPHRPAVRWPHGRT
jgi:hypothetical protein